MTTVQRISTLALQQTTLQNSGRVQAHLGDLQTQISSGLKTNNFQGLNGQVEQFTALEAKMRSAQQYIDNNNLVVSRLETTNVSLDQMIQTANDLQNLIVLRRNPANANSAFRLQLESIRSTMAGELNTNVQGRFLFGGTKTNVPPVIDEPFPQPVEVGTPDDVYYQGSKDNLTVRVQDSYQFEYNVRADNDAFQKIFAGIASALDGDDRNDDEALKKAYDLVTQGLEGVIAIQSNVNANTVDIKQINNRHESLRLYWKGVTEELSKTDLISASTQVSVDQAVLTASFQAFARINALRLSDFL